VNLIGLDLDGTLEDSRDDMVAAARRVRARLGLPAREDSQLRPFVNAGMEQLYRACFDDFLLQGEDAALPTTARLVEVQQTYEADYYEHVADQTRLYDGIDAALRELSTLGTLACITNKPERISRRLLHVLGVGSLFATVVGGDTCAESKPSPLMLETAARHAGFDRERGQAFMIGDTTADMRLGRAYGAATLWCAWGYSESPGETPDRQVAAPAQLAQAVRALADRGRVR
jgi:phosphoglycolate phosphatase